MTTTEDLLAESLDINSCIPKKLFKRNEYGLICDNSIVYIYNDDGTINWRKMIKTEFLVPKRQNFEGKGLPTPSSIDGLEDKDVLILLGGLKELAQTRGYTDVTYEVTSPSEDYVIAVCKITWLPNYETHNKPITFSAIGDASDENTTPMAKNFLGPIAENRAFCRAVRNYLKIHIVSDEEMGGAGLPTPIEDVATTLLRETMVKHGVSFEKVQARLIKDNIEGADKFKFIENIPRWLQFELIEKIKTAAAKRQQA